MSKGRKVLKYSAAGAVTTIYGLALVRLLSQKEAPPPMGPVQSVGTVSTLVGLTWLSTIL